MRTTIRLDDDLAETVKEFAHKEDVSFGKMLNWPMRAGTSSGKTNRASKPRIAQRTFDMGEPTFNVDKALAFAAVLEDEEVLRKIASRK